MPVLRTKKTSNYTVMSNYHFWDEHLSLKAKGMLSFFLALPDDWEFSILGLAKILKEGKYSVQMALQELEQFGYLKRHQTREDNKMGRMEYIIYETPMLEEVPKQTKAPDDEEPYADYQHTENLHPENQHAGNQHATNQHAENRDGNKTIKEENKKEQNTEGQSTKDTKAPAASAPSKRKPLGPYQNVYLSDGELEVLKTEFPKTWEHWITELSEYMEYTGKSYANHLLTIQKWSRTKPLRPAESGAARRYGCPSFNQSPYEPETYYQCDGEDSL